jgi:GH3 auxin-responsive promoter
LSSIPHSLLGQVVEPWHEGLRNPKETQDRTLRTLLQGYAKTDYGARFGASTIGGVDEFRSRLPVASYADLLPEIGRVREGSFSALLSEPVARWVMTRGSTGSPKVIPVTETHLSHILSLGARAVVNFALRHDPRVLEAGVLNLNFPSEVDELDTPRGREPFGYSSGTYAKLHPEFGSARLVPRQEEIDSLGGGIRKGDWERRFELVYQRAKGEEIGSVIGVTPVMVSFASYVRKTHSLLPKNIWRLSALFCTSVAKIHSRYEPILHRLYGKVPVIEMYTATEGVFAQQLDELPYVSPNYDVYLFEVRTGGRVKMLHELKAGEWGSLVISTPLFPRYRIGDLVEGFGKGYFRVFGRDKLSTALEHYAFRVVTGRFL